MKQIITLAIVVLFISCKDNSQKKESSDMPKTYVSFGKKITLDNAISAEEMGKKFQNLKSGDTIDVKFTSTIKKVCKKKGCWIQVGVGEEKNSFVKFKDYGFFMPMNSEGSEVVMNGKAFVRTISVKQLQHYAKDAGKSEEEIAKITKPRVTLAFLADGVLLAQPDEKN